MAPAQSFTVCAWEPGPLLPTGPHLGTEPRAGGPLGLQPNDGRGSHLRPRAGGASAGTLLRDRSSVVSTSLTYYFIKLYD